MSRTGWWLAVSFVALVTIVAFLFSYQYEKEEDMHRFGAFADRVPNAYFNPALNALPRTIACAFLAVLLAGSVGAVFRMRQQIGRAWGFVHRHRIAFAFITVVVLCAILFRYHAFNTARGVYILDRWTGNLEHVRP